VHSKTGCCIYFKITPPFSFWGCVKFSAIISTPQISNPITLEILSAKICFQDAAYLLHPRRLPPVLRLAVDFKYTTSPDSGIVSRV
jgi:hypothetical protein